VKDTVFVIGGCRSGKSRHALETTDRYAAGKKKFIATCIPYDDEMKNRVAQHQKERDQSWETIEAPLNLPEAILEAGRDAAVVLVDCLTLWINNLLMEDENADHILDKIPDLIRAIDSVNCPVVLVSNEVGGGIVPENRLARRFRDLAGSVNQAVAARADEVVWMVAGIPVTIKDKDMGKS
jgi:adenosylcobinamide kinase/adenosylcobinamide-phosphate guanylyltransferase